MRRLAGGRCGGGRGLHLGIVRIKLGVLRRDIVDRHEQRKAGAIRGRRRLGGERVVGVEAVVARGGGERVFRAVAEARAVKGLGGEACAGAACGEEEDAQLLRLTISATGRSLVSTCSHRDPFGYAHSRPSLSRLSLSRISLARPYHSSHTHAHTITHTILQAGFQICISPLRSIGEVDIGSRSELRDDGGALPPHTPAE